MFVQTLPGKPEMYFEDCIVIVYIRKAFSFNNYVYAHLHLFYFEIAQLCNLLICI